MSDLIQRFAMWRSRRLLRASQWWSDVVYAIRTGQTLADVRGDRARSERRLYPD